VSPVGHLAQRQVHVGTFLSQRGTKSESGRSTKTGVRIEKLSAELGVKKKRHLERNLGNLPPSDPGSRAARPPTSTLISKNRLAHARP
jgi:hypothetical protein